MRKLVVTLAALVAAAQPLAAQQHQHDASQPAQGTGIPAGWSARLDRADANVRDIRIVPMGEGIHVTTGPAFILWKPADNMTGAFSARATFSQAKAPMHPEAYGLVLGGSNLDPSSATPEYFYFLVRGDGKFMVRHRAANGELHTVQDWTENAAIHKQNERGEATNALVAEAGATGVRFRVNGTQVAELPGVRAQGLVGLRINHNLDVHVSDFVVTRG
jgi:hypothetical protein